jgi:Fur family zinc uptake transcriptional regulator
LTAIADKKVNVVMTKVGHIIDRAEERCRTQGARLTPKRKQVLSGLVQSDRALSAYELIDICKAETGESFPPMSMYRILDFLRHEHLVHKLDLTNKYVACEHIACDHDHDNASQFLICVECQSVKEIIVPEATMAALCESVEAAGFRLAAPKLEINCVCDRCAVSVAQVPRPS